MVQVSIDISGDKKLQRQLKKSSSALMNWSRELQSSGKFLKEFYSHKVVGVGGGAIGESWPPKKSGGPSVLVDTGKMQGSFRYSHTRFIGKLINTTEYFKFHQTGTFKMPRRLVFKVTDRIAKQVGQIFTKGLRRRLRRIYRG